MASVAQPAFAEDERRVDELYRLGVTHLARFKHSPEHKPISPDLFLRQQAYG